MSQQVEKKDFVLYGATGDLAVKKIIPALFELWDSKRLTQVSRIYFVSRRDWDSKDFLQFLSDKNKALIEIDTFKDFYSSICEYVQADADEHVHFCEFAQKLSGPTTFFWSVSPDLYEGLIKKFSIQEFKHVFSNPDTQVLVEKPFGHSTETAGRLEKLFESLITKNQLYRIDHYLSKAQAVELQKVTESADFKKFVAFHPIQSVTVSMYESKGIDDRGGFYDRVGAVKDVGQNHALMLGSTIIGLVSRLEWLQSLAPLNPQKWVFGQYDGYHQEKGVHGESRTETFFDISAKSHSKEKGFEDITWRFIAGKAIVPEGVRIVVTFKNMVGEIRINVQSTRVVEIDHFIRHEMSQELQDMFNSLQAEDAGEDAYIRLIKEALDGNTALFPSFEEIYASWVFTDKVLEMRKESIIAPIVYRKGTDPKTWGVVGKY
jgi:glucose-6-phosphate 1-dehydrogenase